ncbi:MAG: hypothetical protein Q8L81_14870 [Bacteroidota bacterium]|nr:hypothetical protein [Bacteroidota bacterium]
MPDKQRVINILFLILMIFTTGLFSQKKMSRKEFIKDSTHIVQVKLVRPQFRFDNRTIFIKGQTLNITGFDAGVLLKEKLRLTLGYYASVKNIKAERETIDNIEFEREASLNYGSINVEFIYKNTRYISLGMPLDFNFGKNTLTYTNVISRDQQRASGFAFMTDFGLSAILKPIRWIGIKGIVGYRKTIFNQVKGARNDGFFTSIGIYVDIREVVKDVQMFKLKKKYRKNKNSVETAVDLITD